MDACGICEDTPVLGRKREDVKAHHELPAHGGRVSGRIGCKGGQAGIFQGVGRLCSGGKPAAVCGYCGRTCGQTAGAVYRAFQPTAGDGAVPHITVRPQTEERIISAYCTELSISGDGVASLSGCRSPLYENVSVKKGCCNL